MAYFEKIGALLSTNGVAERILDPSLLGFILGKFVYKAKYKKDYLQVVEIRKEKPNIFKISLAQEQVNEEIKENKFEFQLICHSKEIFEKFDIEKMFLMETGEEYKGKIVQMFLFPEER